MNDNAGGRAAIADAAGQAAGIDAGDSNDAVAGEPGVEVLRRAEVRRLGNIHPQHATARRRCQRLDILGIRTDIADVGKGKGDDLTGERRIGHDLLIAGHRRIEADLANRLAGRTQAFAPKHRPIGQDERSRRAARLCNAGKRRSGMFNIRHRTFVGSKRG